HLPHYDEPGMDPQAYGQVYPSLARLCRRRAQPFLLQAGVELPQGLHDAQPGPHGALRVIFMRQGVAKVDEQSIAEILRDMSLKARDYLGTGLLIGPHHLTQVFRVKLAGEWGRVHQVAEQHGELAAFGVGRTWDLSSSGGWDVRYRWSLVRGVVLGRNL